MRMAGTTAPANLTSVYRCGFRLVESCHVTRRKSAPPASSSGDRFDQVEYRLGFLGQRRVMLSVRHGRRSTATSRSPDTGWPPQASR
jgi:hypothetical protein